MTYAKITDNKLVYPYAYEFRGTANWASNDVCLRRHGYMPLVGQPEQREGFTASPATWHVVNQAETRTELRNADPATGRLFTEDITIEDPGTHESRVIGSRPVQREVEISVDKSYIQVDSWDYAENAQEQADTTERDDAEKAIVLAILTVARQYDAVQDIARLDDITIPALQGLAQAKGMPDTEFDALITRLTPYKWQLEAVCNATWADCWQGLKSRFSQWMQELSAQQATV